MNHRMSSLAFGLALLLPQVASAASYEIDPQHSAVTFRVQHMVISKVTGHFDKFSGAIDYVKGTPKAWKAEATIDAASVNTNVEARDKHLRSPDFLDAEKFPQIAFKTTKVVTGKGGKAELYGDLTIHGVTKPVILALEIGGTVKDPWGNERLGATATTSINRKDFGLTWNKALEAGGVMVGDQVEITLEVEGVAKKA